MKEKKFTRWFVMWSLIIIGCFVACCGAIRVFSSNELKETSFGLRNVSYDLDDITFSMDPPNLINVKSVEYEHNALYFILEAAQKEENDILFEAYNKDEVVVSTIIHMAKDGWLLDTSTGNFSSFIATQICINIMITSFAILLWIGYFKSKKDLGFSYQSIFCIGLAIWVSMISVILLIDLKNPTLINTYFTIVEAPAYFNFLTFPFVFIFSVALIISNISLIRHEGFRFNNVLASLLAISMIGGFGILFWIETIFFHGSTLQFQLWTSALAIMDACYAILECFLIGAIICGVLSARNKPSYDKDYIVILGCMIKEDGTLYPLIRARVDRAIQFYKEQYEKTGKKAIFIPSGGKGYDEPISEAEAMRNYLLEQGIESSQILIENNSKNTRQNMQFSKELIGKEANVVFSTTNFHVFRSGIISRQVGFEADGMGSATKWYFWPNAYVREVIGMISYKWKALVLLFVSISVFLATFVFTFMG